MDVNGRKVGGRQLHGAEQIAVGVGLVQINRLRPCLTGLVGPHAVVINGRLILVMIMHVDGGVVVSRRHVLSVVTARTVPDFALPVSVDGNGPVGAIAVLIPTIDTLDQHAELLVILIHVDFGVGTKIIGSGPVVLLTITVRFQSPNVRRPLTTVTLIVNNHLGRVLNGDRCRRFSLRVNLGRGTDWLGDRRRCLNLTVFRCGGFGLFASDHRISLRYFRYGNRLS